jgi:hypothetical protein
MQTGRPLVNPEARYGTEQSVQVMPGPGGGHVWPPWSYHPGTGLVYIPSSIGGGYSYVAAANFEPNPGGMNMGTGRGGGGGGRGRGAAAPGLDPADGGADNEVAAGPPPPPPPPPVTLPRIGPTGRGNILSAWDPVTQTERWRADGASSGFNQGGTLATGGNLVFSIAGGTALRAFRADTGEELLNLTLGLSQTGPPMTFMLDGVQYLMVAGGPPGGGGRGGRGAAPQGPPQPSRLLALRVDGTTPLPGVTPPVED